MHDRKASLQSDLVSGRQHARMFLLHALAVLGDMPA